MDIVNQSPLWLIRPLSPFAEIDVASVSEIEYVVRGLPGSIAELRSILLRLSSLSSYDYSANLANASVWQHLDAFFQNHELVKQLCDYAVLHFPPAAQSRVIRRLIVHPYWHRYGKRLLDFCELTETSIPRRRWGRLNSLAWTADRAGRRYAGSSERRDEVGVPQLSTVGQLRELLKIRSQAQLGFLLAAKVSGPYTSFEIEKRNGKPRTIMAPCPTLLWLQRRILKLILMKVPADDAAHGFVQSRSTATNAAPHVGAELVLKFDLRDFFPTIHEYRVMGVFASMGYHIGQGRYTTDDRSYDVAPVLARLCCAAENMSGPGILPQGAPTSPAISNLICRRLDQRLRGLAMKFNGRYTRYADDLTFSFDDDLNVGRFRWWVDQICFQEGFTVHQDKFRAIRCSQQQKVTGIVVNERMNVCRQDRRRFRALLHQCRRDGVEAVVQRQPGIQGYMQGFAAYVNMVDPADQGKLMAEVRGILRGDAQ